MARANDGDTIGGQLQGARRRLKSGGTPTPVLDAELLLAHVLGSNREWLHMYPETPVSAVQRRRYQTLVSRRMERVPVAYLTGVKEFYGLAIKVTRRVLIPRPESELLVSRAIDFLRTNPRAFEVIDLGTGSGAIAVAIATAVPRVRVTAIDSDRAALRLAASNIAASNVAQRVRLKRGDLLAGAPVADLIVGNLPYLSTVRRRRLPADVRHEPLTALDGGPDGMRLLRRALEQAPERLNPGGGLLLECDPAQAAPLKAEARRSWPRARIAVHPDLSGRARLLEVLT
jgi:release factor glutamine methyltransferase